MAGRALTTGDILPFVKRLHATISPHRADNALRIGVCVSGGPDSMALAYLLKQAQNEYQLEMRAFIVDHKARSESTAEANTVQGNLKAIGVDSTILSMNWPEGINPLQLSDFESQARTKRYDLLARAALRHDYRALLLGHHQDDQVETILMRLIRNRNLSLDGLAGMATKSAMPSAWDMLGVHTRHRSVSTAARLALPSSRVHSNQTETVRQSEKRYRLMTLGGISIERPLLHRPKIDLVATCETNKVPYVIDPTNKDPRSSLRNAVRHLRTHHKLPQALTASRVLDIQRKAQHFIDQVKDWGDMILSAFQVLDLDVRSGCARVYIPPAKLKTLLDTRGYAYAVSRLTEMVTSNIRINHGSKVPSHILRHLCFSESSAARQHTVGSSPLSFAFDSVQFVADRREVNTWILGRQPMRRTELEENTRRFSLSSDSAPNANTQSEWLLWDNRFWIRIHTGDPRIIDELEIRPLQPGDMLAITDHMAHTRSKKQYPHLDLKRIIDNAAPFKFKFTSPVLTFKGRVVALPTFHYKLTDVCQEMGLRSMTWEVSYNAFTLLDKYPEFIAKDSAEENQDNPSFI